MDDRLRRPIRSKNSVRRCLELLEDRNLLSVIAGSAGAHLPSGGAAALFSSAVAGPLENGSASAVRPRSGMVRAGEGQSPVKDPGSALNARETATALEAIQGEVENRSAQVAAEAADSTQAAPWAAQGNGIEANAATGSALARAAANGDLTALDELSSSGQSPDSSVSSPFGQGPTAINAGIFALAVVADHPQEPTGAVRADPETAPPTGPALGRDARLAGADLGATRVTVSMKSEAVPAIPGGRSPESYPSLVRIAQRAGRHARTASADTGTPGQEQLPPSLGADLLARFSPFDRATVEQALDQFLDRLDELEAGLSRLGPAANLTSSLLASASAIAVVDVFHRYLRKRRDERGLHAVDDEDRDDGVHFPGLPGLPHSWSLE
jgi:hypothetical protein